MPECTIKDIARIVGVSETTVSLAFREKSRIGKVTRRRVLNVARQNNYVPNLAARSLRCSKTKIIGMVVPDITDVFYGRLIRQAEESCQHQGYQLISMESQWNAEREVHCIQKMIELRVEGVLFCSCEKTQESFNMLKQRKLPHVLLDTSPAWYKGLKVGCDFRYAGWLAAEHLKELGCRRIGVLSFGYEFGFYSSIIDTMDAFQKALGTSFHVETVQAGFSIEEGAGGAFQLLERDAKIDAIFCINDKLALGAMEFLEKKGLRVGRDIAVMGIDDQNISCHDRIRLTSIALPCIEQSSAASAMLMHELEKKNDNTVTVRPLFSPVLKARASTLDFKK